jgi:uncharacterized protein YraI
MAYRGGGAAGEETLTRGGQPGAKLVMQRGPWPSRDFPISQAGLLVGRAPDCDVVLDDVEVSRHHARFYWRGVELVVEDLGSTNGTFVNGQPIRGPQILRQGDAVGIGGSVFAAQALPGLVPSYPRPPLAAIPPTMAQPPAPAEGGSGLWLALGGLGTLFVAGIVILILVVAAIWYFSRPPAAGGVPVVTINAPANGAQVQVGEPVTVQAVAVDSKGVIRMELWTEGSMIGVQASPIPQGQSPLNLTLPWITQIPGSHTLEVRAYNVEGRQSAPTSVNVNAVGAVVGGTPTPPSTLPPSVTPLPMPPSPTAPTQGLVTANTAVNVRAGPGTQYPVIGALNSGDTMVVTGRSADGAWWQIVYPANSGGRGWVSAAYMQPNVAAPGAPVVEAPPPPPTATPVPPTATPSPTATAVPPTSTPTPTPPTPTNTPVPPPPLGVDFHADTTTLHEGECTTLRWHVTGVAAYWVDGAPGVGDDGSKQVCDPVGTTTHTLHIQKLDSTTQDFTVIITVQS